MQAEVANGGSREATENDPLLGDTTRPTKKPFYRPRPLWLVPFAAMASIVRGMTLAPRVEIFIQLACNAAHGHPMDYNHTTSLPAAVYHDANTTQTLHSSIFPGLDPAGPDFKLSSSPDLFYTPYRITFPPIPTKDNDTGASHVPPRRCASDPAAIAGAARLQAALMTTMGALSALTTGWWGRFGEMHGRTRVLAASTCGLLLTDLVFLLVSNPDTHFAAHGQAMLILVSAIEGLVGGWATLQGATSAYISDCTSHGSRAHVFSRFLGVFFAGFALGPAIGAALLSVPLPLLLSGFAKGTGSVFAVAAFCSGVNLLLVCFVFPESLPKEKRLGVRAAGVGADAADGSVSTGEGFVSKKRSILGFLSPLAVFLPKKIGNRFDWSLTLLAAAHFGYLLSAGVFQIKYLYAEHVYNWETTTLSYYISWMGAVRAITLLFVLPGIISLFKPKRLPTAVSVSVSTTTPTDGSTKKPKPTPAEVAAEMRFDLFIARCSLALDALSHFSVALAPSSVAALFVGFTTLSSCGAGLVPALQSVALCLVAGREGTDGVTGAGQLFGALAVLQAVGQMIIGPMLFGAIYSASVAKFPKAIFTVAGGITLMASVFLFLVRPVEPADDDAQVRRCASRRARAEVEVERGRSRVSKDLTGRSWSVAVEAARASSAAVEG